MFFDTSHNSQQTALRNIYTAFVETATKAWAYARCLPRPKRPSNALLIGKVPGGWYEFSTRHAERNIDAIKELISVSFNVLSSKTRLERFPGYKFGINLSQVSW